jgi:hypothetical protein
MQVQFAVLHNYHAVSPIPPWIFGRAEQFVPVKKKGRIKHVNRERSTLLLYMGETHFQNMTKRIAVSINGLCRGVRRFYGRIKIRRVVKAMKSELPDDPQSPDLL